MKRSYTLFILAVGVAASTLLFMSRRGYLAGRFLPGDGARFDEYPDAGSSGDLLTAWRESGYVQAYTLIDFQELEVVDLRLNASTQEWESTVYSGSTSYRLTAGGSCGADVFYLSGTADNGDLVVERWILKPKKALPLPLPPGFQTKVIKRTELFRGPMGTPALQVEGDPDGRFALALVGSPSSRRLVSIPSAGGAAVILLDTSSTSSLAQMEYMSRYDHLTMGRCWVLSSRGFERIMLLDSDNDGTFEAPIVATFHELMAGGALDPSQIQDTFDH